MTTPKVGDRAPSLLPLPRDSEGAVETERYLKVGGLRKEEQAEKNQLLPARLCELRPSSVLAQLNINVGRSYNLVARALMEVIRWGIS